MTRCGLPWRTFFTARAQPTYSRKWGSHESGRESRPSACALSARRFSHVLTENAPLATETQSHGDFAVALFLSGSRLAQVCKSRSQRPDGNLLDTSHKNRGKCRSKPMARTPLANSRQTRMLRDRAAGFAQIADSDVVNSPRAGGFPDRGPGRSLKLKGLKPQETLTGRGRISR